MPWKPRIPKLKKCFGPKLEAMHQPPSNKLSRKVAKPAKGKVYDRKIDVENCVRCARPRPHLSASYFSVNSPASFAPLRETNVVRPLSFILPPSTFARLPAPGPS